MYIQYLDVTSKSYSNNNKKEGHILETGEAKDSGEERSEDRCKKSESQTAPFGTWQGLWEIVFRKMKTVLASAAWEEIHTVVEEFVVELKENTHTEN